MKRAIIYGRVSYDDRGNDRRNLDGQIEMGREHALKKDYVIIDEMPEDDRGASGAEIDLPQLNLVREMAHAGRFDVLVVREIDRLSRNLAKQLIVEQELIKAGVVIDYVIGEYPDTPEGNLNKNIKAVIAEYEREKIVERLARGKRRKISKGAHVSASGRAPFGYELVLKDSSDDSDYYTLEIVEVEASIIRFIFQLFLNGLTVEGVRARLSAMGIPTPRDLRQFDGIEKVNAWGYWGRASVYNILTNRTYMGEWSYGKKSHKKIKKADGSQGWKTNRNDASTWIMVKVPAIIDTETFEAVQERLKGNSKRGGKPGRGEWLFSKRVICGECGYKVHVEAKRDSEGRIKYSYYQCPANRNNDLSRPCTMKGFRQDWVDTSVWQWIEEMFVDEKSLEKAIASTLAGQNNQSLPLQRQLIANEEKIAELNGQLGELIDTLAELKDKPKARAIILEQVTQLEETLKKLETQKEQTLKAVKQNVPSDLWLTELRTFAAHVRAALNKARGSFEARKAMIELLDVQISLTVEDGIQIAYATCMLSNPELDPRIEIMSNTTR